MIICQKCIHANKWPKDTVSRLSQSGIGLERRNFRQLRLGRNIGFPKMTLSFLRIPEEQFRKDDEMYIPEFICGLAVGVFLGILLIFAIALIAEKIKKK